MDKQDLQQISNLLDEKLDEKLDQKFEANNKKIFKKFDDKIDDLAITVNEVVGKLENNMNEKFDKVDEKFDKVDKKFDKVDERFNKVENRLKKVEDINNNIYERICQYTDNELVDLNLDMDKVKYIHIDELRKLPETRKISEKLTAKGLK